MVIGLIAGGDKAIYKAVEGAEDSETLAVDLARLEAANIPVDIVFKQGKQVLGL